MVVETNICWADTQFAPIKNRLWLEPARVIAVIPYGRSTLRPCNNKATTPTKKRSVSSLSA